MSYPESVGVPEKMQIPKVEVLFDPPLAIPEEEDPELLAAASELMDKIERLVSFSVSSHPKPALQPGEEDHMGPFFLE